MANWRGSDGYAILTTIHTDWHSKLAGMAELADAADSKADASYLVSLSK